LKEDSESVKRLRECLEEVEEKIVALEEEEGEYQCLKMLHDTTLMLIFVLEKGQEMRLKIKALEEENEFLSTIISA